MGIDYNSATGYGFVVDQDKVRAVFGDTYFNEAMEEALDDFTLLGFAEGSPYDTYVEDTTFAIVVDRLHNSHGYYDGNFGIFILGQETPTNAEEYQLDAAYKKYGTGPIGPLAVFNCS